MQKLIWYKVLIRSTFDQFCHANMVDLTLKTSYCVAASFVPRPDLSFDNLVRNLTQLHWTKMMIRSTLDRFCHVNMLAWQ